MFVYFLPRGFVWLNLTQVNYLLIATMNNRSYPDCQNIFDFGVGRWIHNASFHPAAILTEPHEVGCFSKDANGHLHPGGRKQLRRYLTPPPSASINLSEGYNQFIPKRHGDSVIERIVHVMSKLNRTSLYSADVVTFRNNLNKIGGTIQDRSKYWEIDCCFISNTLFLDILMTDDESTMSHDQKLGCYYGYKYEAVVTGEPNSIVDANPEFCSITSMQLGSHRVLLSSEIDCTTGDPEVFEGVSKYVELKTLRQVRDVRGYINMYRFKYPKFWLQSMLAGVRTISLGLRSDDGTLVSTTEVQTNNLVQESCSFLEREGLQPWSPFLIINFIDHVLTTMRRRCEQLPESTIRVIYDPSSRRVYGRVVSGPDDGLAVRLRELLAEANEKT